MNSRTATFAIPLPNYTVFTTSRNGLPAIVTANRSLLSFQHTDMFTWHLWIEIKGQQLAENGLPTPEENFVLAEVGKEIESALDSMLAVNDNENALFVARATTDGCQELYYQIHNPEIAHTTLQELIESRSWQRQWEYGMECDEDWQKTSKFFQLFARAEGCDA